MATLDQAVTSVLARTQLFEGVGAKQLRDAASLMRQRRFEARDTICRRGDPGGSLFIIVEGLAHVLVGDGDRAEDTVARLRRGDVVGEMSLLTGEPRSATVVAGLPTTVLELDPQAFGALVAREPAILSNLTQILSRRLSGMLRSRAEQRGEAVALVFAPSCDHLREDVLAAAKAANVQTVTVLDARESVDSALARLEAELLESGTVILVADAGQDELPHLRDHVDRVVIVATAEEARAARLAGAQLVLAGDVAVEEFDVIRTIDREGNSAEIGWIGRHLSRTKLGLALGAGGAKGYAHVGALYVLEEAGYTVDYVAGSSIGAIVGSWLGMGKSAAQVDATMRRAFNPERIEEMFKLSFSGASSGLDVTTQMFRETTEDRTFADLELPLVVMTVDLVTRQPAPIREGPLWQALLAATALAGMFPPYERHSQPLVHRLALVPLPTRAVVEAAADVTPSVNIVSPDTLPTWPGQPELPEPPPSRKGSRMLDTILEVMDLAQMDASVRHAALADVVVTPRFGPGSWRDFHLADLFLEAGRQASLDQIRLLQSLARPA